MRRSLCLLICCWVAICGVAAGETWIEQAKLTASDAAAGVFFGVSVAMDGDYIVIGAAADDANGLNSGSAYVFTRSGNIWTEQAKLTASDGTIGDALGASVSINGDYIVVGTAFSGSAYVFARNANIWTEQAKLTASDGATFDGFGLSVAINGDKVVVGADGDDDNGPESGSAYVFTRNGNIWTEQAKLLASDGATGDRLWSSGHRRGSHPGRGSP